MTDRTPRPSYARDDEPTAVGILGEINRAGSTELLCALLKSAVFGEDTAPCPICPDRPFSSRATIWLHPDGCWEGFDCDHTGTVASLARMVAENPAALRRFRQARHQAQLDEMLTGDAS